MDEAKLEPLIVRGRRRYFGKVMLTVTGEGLEHAACGLIPWSSIRSLPIVSGSFGRRLQIDVYDQAQWVARIHSRPARLMARVTLLTGNPLVELPESVVGMTPEALRAEIEARAGRTWPH